MLDYYRTQSEWTDPGAEVDMYRGLPEDLPSIVSAVRSVLLRNHPSPSEAQDKGWEIRRTDELLRRIRALHDTPVTEARATERRLLVNCRQYAVLTVSMLRHKGIPARARAGYLVFPEAEVIYENHWICEYWDATKRRWIRVDAQTEQIGVPEDQFVTAGEGWRRFRTGEAELATFGVSRHSIGWDMVVENTTCDAMALNKTELLPWDVNPYWNRAREDFTESDVQTIDHVAALCRDVDNRWAELREFYDSHPSLRVQPEAVGAIPCGRPGSRSSG